MRKQAGFTVTELMIAMSLSLIMLGVVLRLYFGSAESFRLLTAQSQVQESGRFAGYFLGKLIRPAGYINDPSANKADMFPPSAPALTGSDDVTTSGLLTGTDTITLRSQGAADGFNLNCSGTAVAAASIAVMTVYLDNQGRLFCEDSDSPGTVTPRLLLEDVRDFQLRYGVDTSPSDSERSINRYVTAADVSDFDDVSAVRVGLTIGNRLPTINLQRDFTFTVSLRNRT